MCSQPLPHAADDDRAGVAAHRRFARARSPLAHAWRAALQLGSESQFAERYRPPKPVLMYIRVITSAPREDAGLGARWVMQRRASSVPQDCVSSDRGCLVKIWRTARAMNVRLIVNCFVKSLLYLSYHIILLDTFDMSQN